MIEFNQASFGSAKGILAHPDHYHAIGVTHAKADAGTPGLATLVGTKYIVKAGTIYPANDATAIGVVLNDVDVTNGDANMAVVIHGFIKLSALPTVPAAAAITAMKGIWFMPIAPFATVTLSCVKLAVAVGATTDNLSVVVSIANGKFRPEAATLTNWTFANEAATKLTVASAVVAADGRSITFEVDTSAAAVAGDLTARPSAAVIDVNSQPAAVTIATVA